MQRWAPDATRGDLSFSCLGQGQPATADAPADLGSRCSNLLNTPRRCQPGRFWIFDWAGTRKWIKLTIRDHGAGVAAGDCKSQNRQTFITTKGKGFWVWDYFLIRRA